MARIEWVHHRLLNWQRWHTSMSSGGLGYGTQSVFLSLPSDGNAQEARIPIDDVEGSLTHEAVTSLKPAYGHLHDLLHRYYLGGYGIKDTARILCCAESTVHANLARADLLLAAWFSERRQRKAREAQELREKLEAARSPRLSSIQLPEPPKPRRRGTLTLKEKR